VSADPKAVTRLLKEWRGGSNQALDELMPVVYGELRRLASYYLSGDFLDQHFSKPHFRRRRLRSRCCEMPYSSPTINPSFSHGKLARRRVLSAPAWPLVARVPKPPL
jgi:hypothetical protein